jgi:hypothetical protein
MFNLFGQLTGNMTGQIEIEMAACCCSECGVPYTIPSKLQQSLRQSHNTFYCPNGHRQYYPGKTALEKAKETIKEQEERMAGEVAKRLQTEKLLEQERKNNAASKKKLDRVAKGVCPCCNRSFVNLQRHMATQHPDHKK